MPYQVHESRETPETIEPGAAAATPARADARISASTLEAARAVTRYYANLRNAPTSPEAPATTPGS